MLIKGRANAEEVAFFIGDRFSYCSFSILLGEFGHDCRDHWYFIKFHTPRLKRCDQNQLEKAFCQEHGFECKGVQVCAS